MGKVYLLHFDRPIGDTANPHGSAQHYIGYAEENLLKRLSQHHAGNGARIMAAVARAGIDWHLVRTWDGNRELERRLKRQKKARRLCPICCGERQTQMSEE